MAMIAIGKKGPREKLPPNLQEKEFPNDRKPLSEIVMEGNFEEKNTHTMNNLRTARLKILNNSVLPAVTLPCLRIVESPAKGHQLEAPLI